MAAAAEIEFHAAGATILAQGAEPVEHVRVVRTGAVALLDRGRMLDLLGEGELFGHASMLSGLPTGFAVQAHEDTLCYRLPAGVVSPVLERPAGLRFVARSLLGRPVTGVSAVAGEAVTDPAGRLAAELLRGPPVLCEPQTPIRAAARRMTDVGATAAVVPMRGGDLGILTDRDLRSKVATGAIGVDDPVAAAMTPDAVTVPAATPATDVLLTMLDRGVRHLPVLTPEGAVLGVLEEADLLADVTRGPFHLRRAIAEARTPAELQAAALAWRPIFLALHDARLAPTRIAAMATVITDALTRRQADLAVEELGPPPAPIGWIALGGLARREAVPASDVDSALVWLGADDDAEVRAYASRWAARVTAGMQDGGLPPCDQGARADRPLFARSLDAWQAAFRGWLSEPGRERALILVSLMVDGRPVWGRAVAEPLVRTFAEARRQRALLRLLARFALSHRPPTGFLRDIVVEHSGERRGRFDIKRGGLLPIVDLARWAGMAAGAKGTSTLERLLAAEAAGTLLAAEARTLAEAFDLVFGLRLEHQVQQLRAGQAPDEHIDPKALNPLTRRYLKDAFRAVASVQRRLATELEYAAP